LLNAGADPQVMDQHGKTPLMLAVTGGDLTTVKLLLQKGADPQTRDRNGLTAYDWAEKKGLVSIMEALTALPN
jgi:ankyrin repeat protein